MGDKGPSSSTVAREDATAERQTAIADSANKRADQLFSASFPGFETAETHYRELSTGDSSAIQRETAPATNLIAATTAHIKEQMRENLPRGGASDLAQQEADISKGQQVGSLKANAYLGSFPALAQLAGVGIGLSTQEVSKALEGLQGAGNIYGNEAQQQQAGKAAQLGFFGALAGAGAEGAAAAA